MRPSLPLRTASILSLLFAAGHLAGGLKSWSPPGQTAVLRQMQSFHFAAGGVTRSYFDFYIGLGLMIGLYLLVQAVVLWQLAAAARSGSLRVAPIVATFFAAAVISVIVTWRFIFLVPMAFSAAIAVCLALALYAALRQPVT